MPDKSSQEAGAKEGALKKTGKAAVKGYEKADETKDKAVDKFWENVPGTEGEINPIEEALGPQKDKPSLEKQATQKREADQKEPKKKGGRAKGWLGGSDYAYRGGEAETARGLSANKAQAKKGKGAAAVTGAASKAAKKPIKKAVEYINKALVITLFIIGFIGFFLPPIGWIFYLICLLILYLILLGSGEMAKNLIVNLYKMFPFKFLFPAVLRKILDKGSDFLHKDVHLKLGCLGIILTILLTSLGVISILVLIILLLVLSVFSGALGICDKLGPICDLFSWALKLFDSVF